MTDKNKIIISDDRKNVHTRWHVGGNFTKFLHLVNLYEDCVRGKFGTQLHVDHNHGQIEVFSVLTDKDIELNEVQKEIDELEELKNIFEPNSEDTETTETHHIEEEFDMILVPRKPKKSIITTAITKVKSLFGTNKN